MKKRLAILGCALLVSVTAWLGAQALAPVRQASELMPAGALFYLEASNFSKLVSEWDASPEKKAWLKSANYAVYSRSHLMTRLDEARKAFTGMAGIAEDAPLLAGIAGGESAIAFYNISKLEFLYIAHISTARFADSALGKVKQRFESRQAGGRDYFVKTNGENTIAFAIVDNRLILATREDLVANALQLLAGEKLSTLRQERWFDEALGKAPAGEPDVRFVADLDRSTRTHQFLAYWVQRNGEEIRQFAWEVADLRFDNAGVKEDRVFWRREAQESLKDSEPAVADLLRYAGTDAGFHQAIAKPAAAEVSQLLAEKLFGHARAMEHAYKMKEAPNAPGGAYQDGEDDYETHIDSAVSREAAVDSFAPLDTLAANTDALLQTGGSRAGSVLVGLDSAVALHGMAPWKSEDVKRVLGQVAGAEWSVAAGSLQWADRSGVTALNSVTPLQFTIDGRVLVISTSPDWMARVLAVRAAASTQGASYTAVFRHAQELPNFQRMMKMIDFPSIPQGGQADTREPEFFSESIGSLAAAFGRLDSVSVTAHDTGTMVTESVIYRKK